MSLIKCFFLFGFAAILPAQQLPSAKSLEERAEAEFSKRDCVSAARTYDQAVAAATAAGETGRLDFYYRRIGICRARLGDLDGALDAYTKGSQASESSGDEEMLGENVHGAALTLQKLGRVDEAFPLAQKEYELARKCGHPEHLIRAMWLVSDLDNITGKVRAGIQILEGAIKISRASNDRAGTSILLDNLAVRYSTLGDSDTAMAMETEVLSLTDPSNKLSLAITNTNLGEMQLDAGKTAEAGRTFAKALELADSPDAWRVRIGILTNLARMHLDAREFAAADSASRQALDLASRMKVPLLASGVQRFRAEMFLNLPGSRDLTPAAEAAEAALRLGQQASSSERIYEALFSRANVKDAQGDHPAARADFDEALRITETLRAESPGEASDLRGAFANLVPLYRAAARNLLSQQLPVEALQRAEQAKARVLMDILLRGGGDERSSMTAPEAAERNRLRKSLATANNQALNHPSPASTQTADAATERLRQFERDLYANHPELALQSANFQAAGPAQLAALLTSDNRALLDYFFVPSGVALFVVRRSQVSAFLLPDPGNTLTGEIHRFREQLASRDLDYKSAARHLYARLLGPAVAALGPTTDWIVSPDGAIWEVPFDALMDPNGKHVIETRAISMTPSLTAAIRLLERPQSATPSSIPLLAIGNPLPSSSPLPDAAEEAERIGADRRGAVVLTGVSATRKAFLDQAPNARIIHLAAHAGLNNRDPLSSFVSLGSASDDGMLTAREIMDMHLRADLVVFSACETALGTAGPGEGMIGMGWALSVAGASSSILSYWKIDSSASKDFMIALYRRMGAANTPKASALRQTALEIMQSPGHRHPFYWAPFTLWGS